jgi:hypothetical protein
MKRLRTRKPPRLRAGVNRASLLYAAKRYVRLNTILGKMADEYERLHRQLVRGILPGDTVSGVKHVSCSLLSGNEVKLRKLGLWNEVVREVADAGKLQALLRLHPSLLGQRAVVKHYFSRLVVK